MAPKSPPSHTTPEQHVQNIAEALQEVSERTTTIVQEQIELAKAEVTEKVTRLIKGAVIAIVAGLFATFGLSLLLHGFAWVFFDYIFDQIFIGFIIVAVLLFLLGGLAGWLASRAFKAGAPPTPDMAIEEAKLIKETFEEPFHEDHQLPSPAGSPGLPNPPAAATPAAPAPAPGGAPPTPPPAAPPSSAAPPATPPGPPAPTQPAAPPPPKPPESN